MQHVDPNADKRSELSKSASIAEGFDSEVLADDRSINARLEGEPNAQARTKQTIDDVTKTESSKEKSSINTGKTESRETQGVLFTISGRPYSLKWVLNTSIVLITICALALFLPRPEKARPLSPQSESPAADKNDSASDKTSFTPQGKDIKNTPKAEFEKAPEEKRSSVPASPFAGFEPAGFFIGNLR